MITPETVLKREHPVSHELKDTEQLAVFDEQQSELVVLNAIGGAVWTMIDGKLTVQQIAEEIAENVQGAPAVEQVQEAVVKFAESLLGREAVSIVD